VIYQIILGKKYVHFSAKRNRDIQGMAPKGHQKRQEPYDQWEKSSCETTGKTAENQ
jgi:hypothetical protein